MNAELHLVPVVMYDMVSNRRAHLSALDIDPDGDVLSALRRHITSFEQVVDGVSGGVVELAADNMNFAIFLLRRASAAEADTFTRYGADFQEGTMYFPKEVVDECLRKGDSHLNLRRFLTSGSKVMVTINRPIPA